MIVAIVISWLAFVRNGWVWCLVVLFLLEFVCMV